jgi:hypothetical protein
VKLLDNILKNKGQEIVKGLRENMEKKGLNASGQTSARIRSEVTSGDNATTLTVYSPWTIKAIENPGRKPNVSRKVGSEQVKGIRKWIDDKGITPWNTSVIHRAMNRDPLDSLAWAIATKQAKLGSPVPNRFNPGGVLTDTINDEFIEKTFNDIIQQVRTNLIQLTFDIPYPK